jgi:hypothetical protein
MYSVRRLQELARDYGVPLHAAFVDFRKAFDSVNRAALWRLLRARGVAPKLVELIEDLYSGCRAKVSAGGHMSDWFSMASGVRQGCPLSPTLFNVFIDFLARLITQRCQEQGVAGFRLAYRIGDQLVPVPSLGDAALALLLELYADDLVLLADSAADLRTTLRVTESTGAEWGMQLNYAKTKAITFGGQQLQAPPPPAPEGGRITLEGGEIERVTHFCYLGGEVEASGQQEREISKRLRLAQVAFHQLHRNIFTHRISLATKMRLYKTVVLPTLLYGAAETWALTAAQASHIDAFKTTCLRRILGLRRGPDMPSNAILYETTQQPAISAILRTRRLQWLGHVARMAEDATTKQLMFSTAPFAVGNNEHAQQRRLVGRPQPSWNSIALEDVQFLQKEQSWALECQNRKVWRVVAQSCSTMGLPVNAM